eukprot:COSAG04_NODE_196_length_20686_cov_2.719823_14_plen_99_part_00
MVLDLWQVRVLLLTSHAWDSELKQRLDDKLAAEVVAGSFVIDYSARLGACERCATATTTTATNTTTTTTATATQIDTRPAPVRQWWGPDKILSLPRQV